MDPPGEDSTPQYDQLSGAPQAIGGHTAPEEQLYVEMSQQNNTTGAIFSPSDTLDTMSDISVESLDTHQHDPTNPDHTELCSKLVFYGQLDPSLNISPELKENIGSVRKFTRKISRLLRRSCTTQINNSNQYERAQSDLRETYKIIQSMVDPPELLFNKHKICA